MKKVFLYGMALCMAVLTSCSRDESSDLPDPNQGNNGGGNTTSSVVLPIQIGAEVDKLKAQYNGTKIVEYGNAFLKAKFTYFGDLIKKIDGLGTHELDYDSQNRPIKIVTKTIKILNTQQVIEHTFNYESNNRVKVTIIETQYKDGAIVNEDTRTSEYIYTLDDKGQVIEDRQISSQGKFSSQTMRTIKYQYDDKNSPVKNIKGFDKLAVAKNIVILHGGFHPLDMGVINNVVSQTLETEPNEPLANKRFRYEYEYNGVGYPIKVSGYLTTLHINDRKEYNNSYKYNQ